MSWLFSQALVAEYSAGTSLDGVPCAQLNVMPTPHKFWRNDKTMEFSKLSQFGLTLQLLTVDHGAELLMSYLAVSRDKTSAQPVQVLVSRENEAGYGPNSNALLAKYDPISSMWKTAQCSLFEDLELSLETWPNWGSMRNGESFQRQIPTLPTYENASGSWPTPNARDWKGPPGTACMERGGRQSSLPAAVRKWPTPCASASKGSSPASLTRKTGASRANDRIDHAVMASDGGQLNPEWVEWLMGWPIGWTELKPLAMAKFHEWQQQHGGF